MKNNKYLTHQLAICIALLCAALPVSAQLNAELLHQLVEHSKDEHSRQQTARNKQAITSAQEEVNSHKTAELKQGYTLLQSRFKTIDEALQVLSLGLESAPIARDIARQQQRIVDLASDHPELLFTIVPGQKEIGAQASMLVRYLLGLFISAGDLNQMKGSDRRIFYTFAIDEMRALAASIRSLAKSAEASLYNSKNKGDAFGDFINMDIPIAEDVLEQGKK